MTDKADLTRSVAEIARIALREIAAHKLAPTPENYNSAYRSAAGLAAIQTLDEVPAGIPDLPEAAGIFQELIDTVMQTTSGLTEGVNAWDQESDRILQAVDGTGDTRDTEQMLQLMLASTQSLKETVNKSRQELLETRAQLHRMSEDLQHYEKLSQTDPLTNLCNRRAMETTLRREIARARRTKAQLSVAMLDLDHFKKINDQHGHSIGDQALIHLCNLLKSGLRETDLICRYGGEEFIIVLPDAAARGAHFVVDRLRIKVANSPLIIDHDKITLNVSAGVAALQGGETGEKLIERADKALYQAKENGRNQVIIAEEAA